VRDDRSGESRDKRLERLSFAAGGCKHIESLCIYFEGGDCGHNFFRLIRKNPLRAVIDCGAGFLVFGKEVRRCVGRWCLRKGI
jgi:hypothetical protein